MRVYRYPERIDGSCVRVMTVGNFDGVHRGHRVLLEEAKEKARYFGGALVVLTFWPHPREVLTDTLYPLLTPPEEQQSLLENRGVDVLAYMPFSVEIQKTDPQAFYEEYVFPWINPRMIIVGKDHRFGARRKGDVATLKALGEASGITVKEQSQMMLSDGETKISSQKVKDLLGAGRVEDAAWQLGRRYQLQGTVSVGKGFGRRIGYPTANLELPVRKFLPKRGVYVGRVSIEGYNQAYYGVLNIGYNPVVEERETSIVEVYIMDFPKEESLYGRRMSIDLITYLREEYTEGDVSDLQAWIAEDVRQAKEIIKNLSVRGE